MHDGLVIWKTQNRVFHIAFGSRRWKWCGNANQLTVFRRCVVKNVIAEDTELCTRGVIGRRVGFKFPFLKKSFGSSPNGCTRDESIALCMFMLRGRGVIGSMTVSKTVGYGSRPYVRVKSDHLHFSKLTYQKLLEKCSCVVAESVDA